MKHTAKGKIDWTTAPHQITWTRIEAGRYEAKTDRYSFVIYKDRGGSYWNLRAWGLRELHFASDDTTLVLTDHDQQIMWEGGFDSFQDAKAVAAHLDPSNERATYKALRDGLRWISDQQWGTW